MPSPRVVRSAPARRDISHIYQYVAKEAGLEVADAVVARIAEAMYRAADRPLLYQRRAELRGAPRRINVFRYSIFFEELPDGDGVFVWRVLHGAGLVLNTSPVGRGRGPWRSHGRVRGGPTVIHS